MQPRSYAPVTNTKDNPPCNTLFIGNLSEHTSEDELRGIFQDQPGAVSGFLVWRRLLVVAGCWLHNRPLGCNTSQAHGLLL